MFTEVMDKHVLVLSGLLLTLVIDKTLSIFVSCFQERKSHKRLRVVRVETVQEGRRIVGLHIPNPAVDAVVSGWVDSTSVVVYKVWL